MRWLARLLLLTLLLVPLILALLWSRGWRPPPRFDPWARLDLRAPPDVFFRYKLARLGRDPGACQAALAQAGARFEPLPDRVLSGGCGWRDAVRLRGTGQATLSRPAIVTCPLAATLVLLDRQVLQPGARAAFGRGVARIDHVGSYACRNLYHREDGARSRHARAAAIDVTGFELADGHRVSIAADWRQPGARGVFLHQAHDRACGVAGMVLGPDYNAAHRTHWHVQAGGWGFCR